jgi:hypothetical protein
MGNSGTFHYRIEIALEGGSLSWADGLESQEMYGLED